MVCGEAPPRTSDAPSAACTGERQPARQTTLAKAISQQSLSPPECFQGRRTPACQWGFAVQLAAGVHRSRDGRLMLGGSPPRLLRLNPAAARLLRSGRFAVTDHASAALARRLVDIGVAHPRPPACPVRDVTIVIPVRDRAAALDRLLARLRAGPDSAGLPQSLLAHPLLRPLDDIAYGTGLWAGALRNRSVAHLLPRFAARTVRLTSGPVPGLGAVQPGQPSGRPGG